MTNEEIVEKLELRIGAEYVPYLEAAIKDERVLKIAFYCGRLTLVEENEIHSFGGIVICTDERLHLSFSKKTNNRVLSIPLAAIEDLWAERGLIGGTVHIETASRTIILGGMGKGDASTLERQLKKTLSR